MSRVFILAAMVALAFITTAWAKDSPAESCLRGFLSETAYAVPVKGGARELAESANRLRSDMGLSASLPGFSTESADAWCAFLSGPDGQDLRKVARLTSYAITLTGLEDVDDGIGPLPFDFKPYTLATRYDGLSCEYAITRPGFIASGLFDIKGGHFFFHDNTWRIGRGTEQSAFDRFNLAITENGELVGKIIFWLYGADEGETQQPLQTSVFKPGKERLGAELPTGRIRAITQIGEGAWFNVLRCAPAGQKLPEQYSFDFSKFKIDTKLDNLRCVFLLSHPEGFNGYVEVNIDKGYGRFVQGAWNTGGPIASLKLANVAFTTDRHVVGIFEAWWMFQEYKQARPPALVFMVGKEPKFDKAMNAKMDITVDSIGKLTLEMKRCSPRK